MDFGCLDAGSTVSLEWFYVARFRRRKSFLADRYRAGGSQSLIIACVVIFGGP
jgi:hypothetical protein